MEIQYEAIRKTKDDTFKITLSAKTSLISVRTIASGVTLSKLEYTHTLLTNLRIKVTHTASS